MTIRVAWSASTDPNIASYKVQSSADKATWADRATVAHAIPGANWDATRSLFFWDDATGATTTWYRLQAVDALGQESAWSPPFQASLICNDSETKICNRALSRIGITQALTDYDADTTTEAQECRLWYPQVLRELQEAFDWPWARRHEALSLTALTSTEYQFVYALPDDCLAPIRLVTESAPNPRWDERIPFVVEGSADYAGLLLTDQEDAELVYRAFVENVCYFPPVFKRALIAKLAAHLAAGLKKDPILAERLTAEGEASLRVAMSLAANTGQPQHAPMSSLEAARR